MPRWEVTVNFEKKTFENKNSAKSWLRKKLKEEGKGNIIRIGRGGSYKGYYKFPEGVYVKKEGKLFKII